MSTSSVKGLCDGHFHDSVILRVMESYARRAKTSEWQDPNYLIQDFSDPRFKEILKDPVNNKSTPNWPDPQRLYSNPDEVNYFVTVPTGEYLTDMLEQRFAINSKTGKMTIILRCYGRVEEISAKFDTSTKEILPKTFDNQTLYTSN